MTRLLFRRHIMAKPHRNQSSCVIDCMCDILRVIIDRKFSTPYPNNAVGLFLVGTYLILFCFTRCMWFITLEIVTMDPKFLTIIIKVLAYFYGFSIVVLVYIEIISSLECKLVYVASCRGSVDACSIAEQRHADGILTCNRLRTG